MLVLHVITSLDVGGAERQLVNVVRGTSGDVRHVVCHLGPPDRLAPELREVGCEVIALFGRRQRRYPLAYLRLRPLIDRLEPDVVHSWLFHGRFAVAMAARGRGTPHLASLQGTDYDPSSIVATGLNLRRMALQRRIEQWMAGSTIRYVAASEAVRRSYVEFAGLPEERISIIPNAVDPARTRVRGGMRDASRAHLGISAPDFIFLTIGRLIVGKGHRELFVAFDRCAADDPEVSLLVAGTGPLERPLSRLAGKLTHGDRIRMLGDVESIAELLAAADAFAFPSHSEGFPLALAEAMLAGLPTAATDSPAAREMAGDPPSLLLSPSGDVNGLVASMRTLRSDLALSRQLGEGAARRVSASYTPAHTMPLWLAQYSRIS